MPHSGEGSGLSLGYLGLPGAFDDEGAKLRGFGFDQLVLDHGVDAAATGALMKLCPKIGERFGRA